MQEIKNMVITIIFKAMSMDEITKGWDPVHFKQEVSKMKRILQRKLVKGKESQQRVSGEPAEHGSPKVKWME